MIPFPALLLLIALPLAGCSGLSDSRVNPFTWFGEAAPAATLEPEGGYAPAAEDTRPLVAQVTRLTIEPVSGGVIIRAVGVPPFQGYWDAALVPVDGTDPRTMRFAFRLNDPLTPTLRGPARSREIEVASFVSTIRLDGVRRITVEGAGNSLTRSR
ncbi:MAG: hypothetical protein ACK5IB_04795 [Qingshengfaniella sp.]